ncbi:hypothetical protein [Bradyrhizobium sp. SZCCHNRI20481]|uniref:hypothetical protein n=1 Tax=Bradyrhizobium sp. SZCCHNRI20481 TaxID=3057286 RepID=UPI0029162D97|nr:hypothetical protein [Bradyrhizobium sp. SZCCHNRI20481]
MVTRRKYRKPLAFKDGGAVPVVDHVPPPGTPSEPSADAATHAVPDDPIKQALEAQRRAEELAKQPPPRQPTIEEQIDRIPGISEFKRETLKQYPRLMDPSIAPLASRHYAAALADGVEDDTEAMKSRILGGVTADLELIQRTRTGALKTDPGSPAASAPTSAQRSPVRSAPQPAGSQPRPVAVARRTIPVSAPVSRETPTPAGTQERGAITLSAEERAIARNSFGAVSGLHLSDDAKERMYAANKRRYLAMLASGQYGGQG